MKTSKKVAGAILGGAALTATVAFVAPEEGKFNRPYNDIVGKRTVCYGETEDVQERFYSDDECLDMLGKKLPRYYYEISACWGPEIEARLTDNMRVAFTSGAYNFGAGAFCKSSILRKLKAGDFRGACEALGLYNKGWVEGVFRSIKGLTNRRKREIARCLNGI